MREGNQAVMNTELSTAGRPVRRMRPKRPALDNSRTELVAYTARLPIQVAKRDCPD